MPGRPGIADATIAQCLCRKVRRFRIDDGRCEVHRWSIAQRVLHTRGTA